jgi:20S proteasome alpha/beta subunit
MISDFFFRRIFNIDTHVGMAAAGLISDARSVAQIARDEAASYRSAYTPLALAAGCA